jgi:hypothetical protein
MDEEKQEKSEYERKQRSPPSSANLGRR